MIRQIKIKEQLIRNLNFVGINEIQHPMLGRIEVDRNKISELLKYEEAHLIRFKKAMFK
jgi:hypothetical protein